MKESVEWDKCNKNKEMNVFKEKPAMGRNWFTGTEDFRNDSVMGGWGQCVIVGESC